MPEMIGKLVSSLSALTLLTAPGIVLAEGQQIGRATDFAFTAIDGTPLPLSAFAGRVLLVVNTASFCGFTKQYEGLQSLHETYGPQGLVVIGVPANEFGEQEPGTNQEIAQFCQGAFNVTFPLTEKQVVKGPDAHPFYRWAGDVLGPSAAPRWNFHKYLVGRDGRLIGSFSTQTAPTSRPMRQAIETALQAQP
jgi:glutathione peroxidase